MTTTAAGAGPKAAPAGVDDFDADAPYRISGSVSVRPESFGALVYDFHTRRLSFLKTRALVRVVEALADQPDVHGALEVAEVPAHQREQYLKALAGLAKAGTIQPRSTTEGDTTS
ncbi:mycofactocin biosynthesis chaperone MftB [Actinomycetospora sp. CA-053990]|jgi:mycofactocin biosynthesis protein MftB|uniref:mycofactocin biosynthesis chaperone MftB n=1 Tax=Actinomycetospora sp. CA-053990 TaxID=3239891 RepID=UPI003D8ACB40